jgi:hypothetical protein
LARTSLIKTDWALEQNWITPLRVAGWGDVVGLLLSWLMLLDRSDAGKTP